jgi:hypothetical protein
MAVCILEWSILHPRVRDSRCGIKGAERNFWSLRLPVPLNVKELESYHNLATSGTPREVVDPLHDPLALKRVGLEHCGLIG